MGRQVGDYEIVGELGRGGMAVVHLARARDGSLVAIKELAGFHESDEAAAQRFLREAVVGLGLSHPHIVAVRDRLEADGHPFIVMEWVDGGTLRPFIGELSLPQLAGILEGVLGALGHAGRQGIVHRDLKPENIMLTTSGVAKVADFGIAKAKSAVDGADGRLTRTGTAVGTPGYMAPEQAMGGDVSPATDLYAVGCIAFETLTGRVPFAGQAPMVMLMSHANTDVPDLRTIDPLISAPVADWVAQMTARDPDDRFSDGDAAWAALEAAVVETVGPQWREQATVTPEPAAYTAAPADPAANRATGAFATFSAPVALHEQLAAELGERPAITTPSPELETPLPTAARITRDQLQQAVRQQTPPSVPAAPGPSAADTGAPVQRRRRPPIPVLAGGVVVVIAIIIGVVVAASGGGGSALPSGIALTGAGVTVHAPAGWKTATLAPFAGTPVAAAAAPTGAGTEQGIGVLSVPVARLVSATAGADPRPIAVGAAQAAQVTLGDIRLLLLARRGGGIATLLCRGTQADAVCASVAKTAAAALAAAPTAGDAQTARGVLAGERTAALSAGRALTVAPTGNAQASAAQRIATALTDQRAALTTTQLGVSATSASALLEGGLTALSTAWENYASALSSSRHATAAGAGARVRAAQRAFTAAAAEAAALGLSLGSDLYGGPRPPRAKAFTHPASGNSSGSSSSGSPSAGSSSSGSPSSGSSSSGSPSSGSSGAASHSGSSSSSNSSSSSSSPSQTSTPTTAQPTSTPSQGVPGTPTLPSLPTHSGPTKNPTGGS